MKVHARHIGDVALAPIMHRMRCGRKGRAWKSGWRRRKRAYCRFMPSVSEASIAEQCRGVRYSSTSTAVACIIPRRLPATRRHYSFLASHVMPRLCPTVTRTSSATDQWSDDITRAAMLRLETC